MEKRNSKIIYVFLVLAVSFVAYISANSLTNGGKEQRYNDKMETILSSAKKYGEVIQDKLSSRCYEVTIKELLDHKYLNADKNGVIYDPRTNESMNNKKICITYENDKIITYEKK